MSRDEVDKMSRAQREVFIHRLYGRKPLPPEGLMQVVHQAVADGQGLSLVRAGDVMVDILKGRYSIGIWSFLGLPKPPPPDFLTELNRALRDADVVGLTHRGQRPRWLRYHMRAMGIDPPHVVESFINDSLLADGHLHDLIRRYRVVLVGRSAAAAVQKLSEQGLSVAAHFSLDAWSQLPAVDQALRDSAGTWDLALIGGGESGRILAVRLATELQKVALDIGHAMDGLAFPDLWRFDNRRHVFRQLYGRGPKK